MPDRMGRTVADAMAIQLVEADVEIGFALVDQAKDYRASAQPEFMRALQAAGAVVADIERRLQRLGDSESGPFHPLVTELRKEITALERETF